MMPAHKKLYRPHPKPTAQDIANYNYPIRSSQFFKNPEDFLKMGQRCKARFRIFDLPNPGKSDDWGWVSAEEGEEGTVVHVEKGYWPTVRFDNTGAATCVTNFEVDPI
jgi:hypothetical protein